MADLKPRQAQTPSGDAELDRQLEKIKSGRPTGEPADKAFSELREAIPLRIFPLMFIQHFFKSRRVFALNCVLAHFTFPVWQRSFVRFMEKAPNLLHPPRP